MVKLGCFLPPLKEWVSTAKEIMSKVIYLGKVISTDDEYNGGRIRAKISLDGTKKEKAKSDATATEEELYPYAFPLLPKMLQTIPKVGEMVFVILSNPDKRNSIRYYIGPVISQPQKMYFDEFDKLGSPASLLPDTIAKPLESTTHFAETFGSYPKRDNIALIGRKGEDVILKDDEVNIRCGIRNEADGSENKSLVGEVLFNSTNPSYIQLKHQRNNTSTTNLINLVGGSINLMSNEDANKITSYMKNYNNNSYATTYNEPSYEEIMSKLHQIPYGDILVDILEILRDAILNHTHPLGDDEPPFKENISCMTKLQTWGQGTDPSQAKDLYELLLSQTVRIS